MINFQKHKELSGSHDVPGDVFKESSLSQQVSDFRKGIWLWYNGISFFDSKYYEDAANMFKDAVLKSEACLAAYFSLYLCCRHANKHDMALHFLDIYTTVSIKF